MVGISLTVCPFSFQSPYLAVPSPESPHFCLFRFRRQGREQMYARLLYWVLSPSWYLFPHAEVSVLVHLLFAALSIFHRWDTWVINSLKSCTSADIFGPEKWWAKYLGALFSEWSVDAFHSFSVYVSAEKSEVGLIFFFLIDNMFFIPESFWRFCVHPHS